MSLGDGACPALALELGADVYTADHVWANLNVGCKVDSVGAALDTPIEFELEDDGRWIAEMPALPGVMAYGTSKQEAESKVRVIASLLRSAFAKK